MRIQATGVGCWRHGNEPIVHVSSVAANGSVWLIDRCLIAATATTLRGYPDRILNAKLTCALGIALFILLLATDELFTST